MGEHGEFRNFCLMRVCVVAVTWRLVRWPFINGRITMAKTICMCYVDVQMGMVVTENDGNHYVKLICRREW